MTLYEAIADTVSAALIISLIVYWMSLPF